ncbi:MAG TPA: serine/threonine-protein kinase [Ignavibacteriaceae bacterium]|nr:serine/threonine-protein kinase [Ignavibacteriaceae bacterium]
MDKLVGQVIDNYKILEIIGRGGMGVVFKAIDLSLEKVVALKMIDPLLAKDDNFLNRFKTEAKALARLENSNIVGVYALRDTEYGLFMVMEYVQAKTISEWIREKGRFSSAETKEIARHFLKAIGHAHKVGVIHRDIKPNNILLCDDGTVKVMDFGLAKVVQDHAAQSTVTQIAAGTLYYMSPEQIKGLKNVDKRSDIYAIGMTIYEMLAGRTPFEKSESEFTIQKQIVEGKIPPPSKYNPLIPKAFVKMIMKAIEKDADKRYQTVPDMLAELENIQVDDQPVNDKTRVLLDPKTQINTEPKKKSFRPVYIYSAVGFLIIAAIIAYLTIGLGDKKDSETDKDAQKTDTLLTTNNILASLSISSEPSGAKVFLNEKNIGSTPLIVDSLKTDIYNIKVRLSGYEQWTAKDYRLFEGMNNLQVPLKPVTSQTPASTSTLVLKAEPEGTIFIGNRQVGSGKDAIRSEVTAGSHTVKFVHPQFGEKLLNVNLSPNQTENITCYFQQKVTIQSLNKSGDSFWGNIFINGENTNRTTPADMMLGPGSYRITVKKTGFKTVENDVVLNIQPAFELKNHPLVFHFE